MSSPEPRYALEESPEPRVLVDDQLQVVAVNDAYLARLELPREQVLGRPLLDLLHVHSASRDEIERTNEHLRVALAGAKAMSWEWDMTTHEGLFSESLSSFFGVPEEEIALHGSTAVVHPEDRQRVAQESPSRDPDKEWMVEFRGLERSGGPRYYEMRGKVLKAPNGKSLRMVGVTWDVTERHRQLEEHKALEQRVQEAQRLESLGVLAGGIAHDFNNILLAILGNANLARMAQPNESAGAGFLEQIEDAACRAADLCKQLLAYAGKGHFVLAPTDLNQIVQDTVHLLKVSIDRRVTLSLDLAAELPSVVSDVTQLRQVLMNLVLNASDASRERGGRISIHTGVIRADRRYLENARLTGELTPGEYVSLDVTDNGEGMSQETMARIFEPFFTTKFTGRGLGLSAVLGIVRGHKGALQVNSQLGVGSRFTLLLPAVDEPPSKTHTVPRSLARIGNGETVLVVDDEDAVRSVTAQMVNALGFEAITARDGSEALALYQAQRERISCVVMDMTMPNPSGLETLAAMRGGAPLVKVLLMSGYAEQENRLELVPGLTGYLQKPFKMDDLRESLRKLMFRRARL